MSHRQHVPSYRLHKQSGQAIVTLSDGQGKRKDFTLGEYGSPESRAEYARLLAEWEANHHHLPKAAATADPTINELLVDYWPWAKQHYRNDAGEDGQELENLQVALRPLRLLYGHTPATQFGPLALRALQDHMVKADLARTTINARINRVRRFFKWAVSFERLPAHVHQALAQVPGLQRGRGNVRESKPITSIPLEVIEATLPFMPATIAAMVRLQLLCGCRPGEIMRMRAQDIDTTKPEWEYRPSSHKNKHRGLDRVIFLGAQAQEVLRPFLTADPQAFLFSPRAYVEALHAQRAQARKTKRTPSEKRRQRKAKPKRKPSEQYNRRSYLVAVTRAMAKANRERARQLPPLPPLPHWSPLQLRHTAGTLIRAKYGLEASRVVLGHTRVETTQIYAERDLAKAAQIISEIG